MTTEQIIDSAVKIHDCRTDPWSCRQNRFMIAEQILDSVELIHDYRVDQWLQNISLILQKRSMIAEQILDSAVQIHDCWAHNWDCSELILCFSAQNSDCAEQIHDSLANSVDSAVKSALLLRFFPGPLNSTMRGTEFSLFSRYIHESWSRVYDSAVQIHSCSIQSFRL